MERERRVVEWVLEEKDRYRRVGVADWRHVDGCDLEKAEGARGGLVAGERPSVRPLRTGERIFLDGGVVEPSYFGGLQF
jgi:hypothetical protein